MKLVVLLFGAILSMPLVFAVTIPFTQCIEVLDSEGIIKSDLNCTFTQGLVYVNELMSNSTGAYCFYIDDFYEEGFYDYEVVCTDFVRNQSITGNFEVTRKNYGGNTGSLIYKEEVESVKDKTLDYVKENPYIMVIGFLVVVFVVNLYSRVKKLEGGK